MFGGGLVGGLNPSGPGAGGRHRGAPARARGTGYGGGGGGADGGKKARAAQEAAAERQQAADVAAGEVLSELRQLMPALGGGSSGSGAGGAGGAGPLPLPAAAVLHGGPLPHLLRLLLANDSLMDVSARRPLYSELFRLLSSMATSQDLLTLLLAPADADQLPLLLPPPQAQAEGQGQQREQQSAKRARKGAGGGAAAGAAAALAAPAAPVPAAPTPASGGAKGSGAKDGSSSCCWAALQALRLQADVFRSHAERVGGWRGDVQAPAVVGSETLLSSARLCTASHRPPLPCNC